MKTLLAIIAVLMLAGCSQPRFMHVDVGSTYPFVMMDSKTKEICYAAPGDYDVLDANHHAEVAVHHNDSDQFRFVEIPLCKDK